MKSIRHLVCLLVAVIAVSSAPRAAAKSLDALQPRAQLSTSSVDQPLRRKHAVQQDTKMLSLRGGVANTLSNALVGTAVMAVLEKVVKKGLAAADIKFPAALGGCIFLFFAMLLTEAVSPKSAAWIFDALTPGSAFLAQWLPVFFVPGLVMLPLAPSVGNSFEVGQNRGCFVGRRCRQYLTCDPQKAKVLLVVVLGFFYTISTTTYAVLGAMKATGKTIAGAPAPLKGNNKKKTAAAPAPAKPFSDDLMALCLKTMAATSLVSLVAHGRTDYATPLQTLFLAATTVTSYVWGARLPTSVVQVVHPLVTSSVLVLATVRLLAVLQDSPWETVLRTYRVGSLDWQSTGAGDILLYLLGPSVVSFAISIYSRRQLLAQNLPVVLTAVLVASGGSLFGTAAFVRLIRLGGASGKIARLSVLARNITTALSIALTSMLGGDMSIAASVVVVSGIFGATYGKSVLQALQIHDPIARGLAMGASAQGLGVASIRNEPDAFPFAAISMVLTAIAATVIVAIPALKDALIQVATGDLVV